MLRDHNNPDSPLMIYRFKAALFDAYVATNPPPLPTVRVEDADTLTVTGVDFSGALHVRNINGRDTKAYICLFTCASTRTVHLELVHNLSTETGFTLAVAVSQAIRLSLAMMGVYVLPISVQTEG